MHTPVSINMNIQLCLVIGVVCGATFSGCRAEMDSGIQHYRNGGSYFGTSPSRSADGMWFVYSSPRTGNGDIYKVDVDGTTTTRLTSDEMCEYCPSYSPDGKNVVFISGTYGRQITVMNLETLDSSRAFSGNFPVSHPEFMPNGETILFLKESKGRGVGTIALIDRDGSKDREISQTW